MKPHSLFILCMILLISSSSIANTKKKKSTQPETVCQHAAKIGKSEFLKKTSLSKTATHESELRKMFSVDSFSEVDNLFSLVGTDAIDITKVDLNNDGTADYILHRREGSIQCGAVAVLLGRKDYHVTIAGVPDFNSCDLSTSVYNYQKRNYLVFSTSNETTIQEVKDNKLTELCAL